MVDRSRQLETMTFTAELPACWETIDGRSQSTAGQTRDLQVAGLATNHTTIVVLRKLLSLHLHGDPPISLRALHDELEFPWSRRKLQRLIDDLRNSDECPLVADDQPSTKKYHVISVTETTVERYRTGVAPAILECVLDHAASLDLSKGARMKAEISGPLEDDDLLRIVDLESGIDSAWRKELFSNRFLTDLKKRGKHAYYDRHARTLASGRAVAVYMMLLKRRFLEERPVSMLELHLLCALDGSPNSLTNVVKRLGSEGPRLIDDVRKAEGHTHAILASDELADAFTGRIAPRIEKLVFDFIMHLIDRNSP